MAPMPQGSIRRTAAAGPLPERVRRGPGTRLVPWDWTDMALFFALFFLGLSLLSAILLNPGVEHFGRSLVHGLSPQQQTALGNFVEQAAVYALAMIIVAGFALGRRHARLADLGWRLPRLRWLAVAVVVSAVSLVTLT